MSGNRGGGYRERAGPPPPPDEDYPGASFGSEKTSLFSGAGQSKQFFDGDYTGELIGDKKQGRGVMRFKNGTKYEGQWSNDLRHGQGTFFWPDGSRYEGQFAGGQMGGGESSGFYFTADGKKCDATWVSAPANTSSRNSGY
jgi:hypothetical protein